MQEVSDHGLSLGRMNPDVHRAQSENAGPIPPPPHMWPASPQQPRVPPHARPRGGVSAWLGIAASVLATAALIVAVIALVQRPSAATDGDGPPPLTVGPTGTDDKAVCEAIAPLIREAADQGKTFFALGDYGTPARDAAIPEFVQNTKDWVDRAQAVVDAHMTAGPPDYLMRSLQRFIDDRRAYAENIRPGPATEDDNAAWGDSLVAGAGLIEVCSDLGVQLW